MVPVGMENPNMQRHNMTVHSLVSYNTSSDELFIDGLEREKSLVYKAGADSRGGRTRRPPPKIGKNMIFWA